MARRHDALLLDAGNTLVFLSHEAIADVVTSHGHLVDARVLAEKEGIAKRQYEDLMAAGVTHQAAWGLYLRVLLEHAGLETSVAASLEAPLRLAHEGFNLWRRVPPGTAEALARARDAGMRVAVVSNSEGKLPELFERVGLAPYIERVVDSHYEGVRKPDPEIFRRALERLGVSASRSVYLGDMPGVDVLGARAAGLDAVLVDPYGYYASYVEAPRVASVAEHVDSELGPA